MPEYLKNILETKNKMNKNSLARCEIVVLSMGNNQCLKIELIFT